jgi:hypothetical protein
MPDSITITLTVEELMRLPGDAVIQITNMAKPSLITLTQLMEHENRPLHGKGRWPVINHLRQLISAKPRVGCAACDRNDYQFGHAEGCPNATV